VQIWVLTKLHRFLSLWVEDFTHIIIRTQIRMYRNQFNQIKNWEKWRIKVATDTSKQTLKEFIPLRMKRYFSWRMDIICYFIIDQNGGVCLHFISNSWFQSQYSFILFVKIHFIKATPQCYQECLLVWFWQ